MSIRAIQISTPEQLAEAFTIRTKVFVEEQNVPPELELDELDQTASHVLALDAEGCPVATGRLIPYGENAGKLQRIAVQKVGRGKGYGQAVVEALEEIGRSRGYTRFVLDAQIHAEGFYQKIGYRTVSPQTFLDAGIPHVRMEKRVASE